MRKLLFVVAAALAIPGMVASAGASEQQPRADAAEEAKDPDKMICKRESVVGSRVQKKRVCMTRSEWAKLQNGTRDALNEYIKSATGGAPRN